jgi:cell division protein FtsB
MDLRLGPTPRIRILPRAGVGVRADVRHLIGRAVSQAISQTITQTKDQAKNQGPRAEAAAARCIDSTRPVWTWLAREWRRLGTVAAGLLIVGLILHATFGANGMVVYQQKHAELQSLQAEVERLQKENGQYADRIKALKSDPAAIEKEAREQLHYTRPREFVYVSPEPSQKPATGRAGNAGKR